MTNTKALKIGDKKAKLVVNKNHTAHCGICNDNSPLYLCLQAGKHVCMLCASGMFDNSGRRLECEICNDHDPLHLCLRDNKKMCMYCAMNHKADQELIAQLAKLDDGHLKLTEIRMKLELGIFKAKMKGIMNETITK